MQINNKMLLSAALDIGEQMLISGAEIYRVEDCIKRICRTYGAQRIDVLTITSSIIATLQGDDGDIFTQTRRIKKYDTDLNKLDRLNDLSREICATKPSLDTIQEKIAAASLAKTFSFPVRCLAYALVSGSFTLFFGGGAADAVVSSIIGILLCAAVVLTGKSKVNSIFAGIMTSFLASLLAFLSAGIPIQSLTLSPDKIIIGNIMILIPGVGLTNSIRDMINGDTISGMLRFSEACLVALGIAAGYFIAAFITGGAAL